MIKMKVLMSLVLSSFFIHSAYAQLNKLTGASSFSPNAVSLNFENQKEGAEAGDLFSQWGIVFLGRGSTVPKIRTTLGLTSIPNNVLRNEANIGSSANDPLIVNFRFPAKRVGFRLGNGSDTAKTTIKAFDALGTLLGTIEQTGLAENVLVGVESILVQGISKVTIDYGDSPNAEQVDDLTVDFVARPRFTTFLAQVADGTLANGSLQTAIVISNLTNSTAQGDLRLSSSNGTPLTLTLRTGEGVVLNDKTIQFSIPAFSSRSFVTAGTSQPAKAGYARIDSSVPVEGTAIFQVLDGAGKLVSEAGVGIATAKVGLVGVVRKFVFDDLNSGVAVVNTSNTTKADARITVFDERGVEVAFNETILDLEPGRHTAAFLSEMFSELTGDFRGSVLITSDQPLAVVILRTKGGVPISSLPVGSTQK